MCNFVLKCLMAKYSYMLWIYYINNLRTSIFTSYKVLANRLFFWRSPIIQDGSPCNEKSRKKREHTRTFLLCGDAMNSFSGIFFLKKVKKNVVMRCWMLFNAWKFMQSVSYARQKKKNANFVVGGRRINLFTGF